MKKIWVIILATALIGNKILLAEEITSIIGVGASTGLGPQITGMGDEVYKVSSPSNKFDWGPIMVLEYKNLVVKGPNITYKPFKNKYIKTSLQAKLSSGFSVDGSEMEAGYQTIHNRESQSIIGAGIGTPLSLVGVQPSLSFLIGEHGEKLSAGFGGTYTVLRGLFMISPYVKGELYSRRMVDYYFGVDQDELGGELTQTYEPSASVALNFGCEVIINTPPIKMFNTMQNFSIILNGGVVAFDRQVKDSPLVKKNVTGTFEVGFSYNFFNVFEKFL